MGGVIELTMSAPPIVHDVLRCGGQPLDADTRAFVALGFGRDLTTAMYEGIGR